MADSYYILDQQKALYGSAYFFTFIFIVILLIYWKVYGNDWLSFNINEKSIVIFRFTVFLALIVAIYFSTNTEKRRYERIFRNGVITKGITVKELRPGRGEHSIEYRFSVNNKVYTASIGYCYGGEYIPNIKVPNGRYRVIYNSKNPEESIMDFKIPEEEK